MSSPAVVFRYRNCIDRDGENQASKGRDMDRLLYIRATRSRRQVAREKKKKREKGFLNFNSNTSAARRCMYNRSKQTFA